MRSSPTTRGAGITFGFTVSAGETESAPLLKPPLDDPPVDVPEKRLDVLAPFRRLVVTHEGVLPHIHHEQWHEAGGQALLVQRDPVIRQPVSRRILKEDHPADTPHFADRVEGRLPLLDRAEGLSQSGR